MAAVAEVEASNGRKPEAILRTRSIMEIVAGLLPAVVEVLRPMDHPDKAQEMITVLAQVEEEVIRTEVLAAEEDAQLI